MVCSRVVAASKPRVDVPTPSWSLLNDVDWGPIETAHNGKHLTRTDRADGFTITLTARNIRAM